MGKEEPRCSLCNYRLASEAWTDSDEYGDCHERCLSNVEAGRDWNDDGDDDE